MKRFNWDILKWLGGAMLFSIFGMGGVDPVPTPDQAPIPAVNVASDTVGALGGQAGTTPGGAATFSIPLVQLAGSGGHAPQVSLNYNSQGGNGPLGLGWSVGGLSGISRTRRTFEEDGVNAPVTLTDSDRFSLDGQRLVLTKGIYGGNLSEYHTEIDSFTKVVAYGEAGVNGPASFRVFGKDGSISTYGGTADSRYQALDGTPVTWAMSRVEDRNGNFFTYEYSQTADGEQLIENIRFTGNEAMGLAPYNRIGFVYELRSSSDRQVGYRFGRKVTQRRRLAYVGVYTAPLNGNEVAVRHYFPEYGLNSANQQIITAWEECVGQTCLPATTFTYHLGANQWAATAEVTSIPETFNGSRFGDVTGNGRPDLVWLELSNNGNIYFQVAPSTGSGFDFSDQPHIIESDIDDEITLRYWQLLDYDQDGRQDLLVPVAGLNWYVHRSTGSHFEPEVIDTGIPVWGDLAGAVIADADNDGLVDLLLGRRSGPFSGELAFNEYFPLERAAAGATYPFRFGGPRALPVLNPQTTHADANGVRVSRSLLGRRPVDFDGDGQLDYVAGVQEFRLCLEYSDATTSPSGEPICLQPQDPYPIEARLFTPDENGSYREFYTIPGSISPGAVYALDLNGDILVDLLYGRDGAYFFRLNRGDHTFTEERAVGLSLNQVEDRGDFDNPRSFGGSRRLELMDVDGDGDLDLLYPQAGGNRYDLMKWTGDGYSAAQATTAFYSDLSEEQHLFSDVNGDGLPDFVRIIGSVAIQVRLFADPFKARHLLSTVTDGLGAQNLFTYKALTEPGVYTREFDGPSKDWGKGSPVYDMFGPMYVVTAWERSAPVASDSGATARMAFRYGGAKMQGGGRGSLGFRFVASLDTQTGLLSTSKFLQEFPYTGLTYELGTIQNEGAGHPLSLTVNLHKLMTSPQNGVFPVLFRSASYSYDLEGRQLAYVNKLFQYDDYGNTTSITEETHDGRNQLLAREVTTNLYQNHPVDWLLGQLRNARVATTRGAETLSRETGFDYDPVTGRLLREYVEPQGNPDELLLTEYAFDGFGNRVRATVRPLASTGLATRTTTFHYDPRGRFVDAETHAEGQTLSRVVSRDQLGTPTRVESANGLVTESATATFGRVYFTRVNTGQSTETVHRWCDGLPDCPSSAVTRTEVSNGRGQKSLLYLDRLGRTVREAKVGFNGRTIGVDMEYDAAGRMARRSQPYFLGDPVYWTTMAYDLLGRPVRVQAPDGGLSTIGYDGLEMWTTNPLMQTEVRIQNALGETVSIWDAMGGLTRYFYNPQGNLAAVEDPAGNFTRFQHDKLGRKTLLDDPDKGLVTYLYNAFGELVRQTDAKLQSTLFTYDRLGRQVARIDQRADGSVESDARWFYDSDPLGSGDLLEESDGVSGFRKIYGYDDFGRPNLLETEIGGIRYEEKTTYDQFGRIFQSYDAAGGGVRHRYNSFGYLSERLELDRSKSYQVILDRDAYGNTIEEMAGNGLVTHRQYDKATNRIQAITTGGDIQILNYEFDLLGNITQRRETSSGRNLIEHFDYDALNRLVGSSVTGGQTMLFSYDVLGNITSKSNVGTYVYAGSQPHAVTRAGNLDYGYDDNGNLITVSDGRTLRYTTFDKVTEVNRGEHTSRFAYGTARHLIERTDLDANGTSSKRYVGSVEFITLPDGRMQTKRYVGDAVITVGDDGTEEIRYIHKDHLGSMDVVTAEDQRILADVSFDAFGQRRHPFTWFSLVDPLTQAPGTVAFLNGITNRAFTGHEQLDDIGFVNMGGRLYDPNLGRFVQADLFAQDPTDSQSLNRYSYVLNNPLSYTDPSGFLFKQALNIFKDIFKGRLIQAVVNLAFEAVNAFLPGVGTALRLAYNAYGTFLQARAYFTVAKAIGDGNLEALLQNTAAAIAANLAADVTTNQIRALTGLELDQREALQASGQLDAETTTGFADCGYDSNCDSYGSFRKLTNLERAALGDFSFLDTSDGLKASIFQNSQTREIVVTYDGTDLLSGADWYTNVLQGLGLETGQYNRAIQLGQFLNKTYGLSADITFVGHSLGGGLASAAALATGRQASTINAAGLSQGTLQRLGADRAGAERLVTAYSVRGDVLTLLQDATFLPSAVGIRSGINPSAIGIAATPVSQHLLFFVKSSLP